MWGAASPPHAVRKGRCASPPRRLPSTPLLTGLPPRFFRHWRRSAPPPWPAFKKAGENWLESFLGFPTAYAGPPLTGSGGLVLLVGFRGEKRLANGSLGRRKIPAFPGGRRARTARTKHGRGPWPRPCFGFAGLGGPRAPQTRKTPPPPGAPQRQPASPRQHASVGSTAVARWRPGRPRRSNGGRRRLAAVGRPAGPPHCPALSGRFAPRSRSSQRSLCVAAKAASFNSLAHWASASLFPPLAALGSRSSQRSLCVAAKAASFNSLAHWASASLFPPLAALGSAPLRRVFHQRQKDPKKRLPQTKRAAPDERRASIIRRKTGKVFQLVFPRFFKSGWGSGGKAPGKIQRYPQRPYAVSISKAASRRHTQNTSRAASSSATGGRLGAMRILLSWGSLP